MSSSNVGLPGSSNNPETIIEMLAMDSAILNPQNSVTTAGVVGGTTASAGTSSTNASSDVDSSDVDSDMQQDEVIQEENNASASQLVYTQLQQKVDDQKKAGRDPGSVRRPRVDPTQMI